MKTTSPINPAIITQLYEIGVCEFFGTLRYDHLIVPLPARTALCRQGARRHGAGAVGAAALRGASAGAAGGGAGSGQPGEDGPGSGGCRQPGGRDQGAEEEGHADEGPGPLRGPHPLPAGGLDQGVH